MRSPNLINGVMQERIDSADGQRWAYSRFYKMMIGRRRYGSVKAWVLKYYNADGKAIVKATGMDEATARKWVGEQV